MKKALIILITFHFSLFTSLCSAQDVYRHAPPPGSIYTKYKDTLHQKAFFFSFNAGLSAPLRQFASKDTSNNFMSLISNNTSNAQGFAQMGYHASVKGGIFLSQNFGVLAKIQYNYNTYDVSALNTILNGAYYYTINGNFNIWQFMGGGFFNAKLSRNLSVWVDGMAGDIIANYPSFTALIGGLETYSGTVTPSKGLGYAFSTSLEAAINENVSFLFAISYTGAIFSYPTSSYSETIGSATSLPYTQYTPITMSYGSLDFSIGFLVHL